MSALDASTGAVVWRTAYAAPFKIPDGTGKHGLGPKSTPAYAEGRIFALGLSGIFSAFDAKTGKLLWQKPGTLPQAAAVSFRRTQRNVRSGNAKKASAAQRRTSA